MSDRTLPCVRPAERHLRLAASVTLSLCTLASAPGGVRAQTTRPLGTPPAYTVQRWTTQDGLPENSVNAIVEDPSGYLWVGTFGGLARFDGTTFERVPLGPGQRGSGGLVLSLAVGPDSSLWVGTGQGLYRVRHGKAQAYGPTQGIAAEEIRALLVDRDGAVWIGTGRGGVARLAGGAVTWLTRVGGAPIGGVVSLMRDTAGGVWVDTPGRVFRVRAAAPPAGGGGGVGSRTPDLEVEPAPRGFSPGARLLLAEGDGTLWFRTAHGLARLRGSEITRYGLGSGVPPPDFMLRGSDGYWLGTFGAGPVHFRPLPGGRSELARPGRDTGARDAAVRSVFRDRDGNVWFGTGAGGLLRVGRRTFTMLTTREGLSDDFARPVMQDRRGRLWVGAGCGAIDVISITSRRITTLSGPEAGGAHLHLCVSALTEDSTGAVWVGSFAHGLSRVVGSRWEGPGAAGTPPTTWIDALFTDRSGTVWAGIGNSGLARIENGRVVATYTTADGLAGNEVHAIAQGTDGALWVGSNGGLSRLANGRVTSWTAADGLPDSQVRALYREPGGTLWIGTYGGGLSRFRDGRFVDVTRADGLAEDVVSEILPDGDGNLWMSGTHSVFRAALRDLNAFADGRTRHVHVVTYGAADGLVTAALNGGFQPAGVRDRSGRLWFPTQEGLAMVDPRRAAAHAGPHVVTIDSIGVNGRLRPPGTALVLGPGRINLEFRYASPAPGAARYISYRYRLEGLDNAWLDVGNRRVAYYSRLAPGRYRFRVEAAGRSGRWGSGAASVELRVVPHLWNTWWVRLAVALTLLAGAAAALRRRGVRLRSEQRAREEFSRRLIEGQDSERKRIAGDLHDGLGQDLLVIRNRALLALRSVNDDGQARDHLQHIAEVARVSLEGVRSLAHHLMPHQLEHLGLADALRDMVEDAEQASDVAFDVEVGEVGGMLTQEGDINLFRIVQEAVNNVLKHAHAAAATVRVRPEGGAIHVVVADDGRGFATDGANATEGFGLSGIAERVRILGGRMRLKSAPGHGTHLEITIPAARVAGAREPEA